jgi:hypothetical protein
VLARRWSRERLDVRVRLGAGGAAKKTSRQKI